jgi:putative membrane protein
MVICMAAMAWMMMGHGHGSHTSGSHGHRPGGAQRILAERLARGEIDIDEYERRLTALRQAGELDRTEEVTR